jgi:glycosyltransferase involved in cell wall biosynthesis
MKVFLYGNILNNSYNLCIFLRRKGINAHMFLDDSSALEQDYPWWEDTNLSASNLPEWIHYYRLKPNFWFPQPELKKMISDFSQADVALVCGWGPIIAQRAKVPYLFHSYGSDLNITNFYEGFAEGIRNLMRLRKPKGIKTHILLSHMQKRAIQKANLIGIYMGYQVNTYVKPLGILDKMRKMRLAWDVDKYKVEEDSELRNKYGQYEVVYFMISRHTWKSVWSDLKGNDKFLRAFARFVKEKRPNVRLVCIEKGIDLKESKKLIAELQISNYVEWVKEMNKDGIRAYNSLTNGVVVDQFWHNQWYRKYPADKDRPRMGFGSGSIEALSAQRPLITAFFDEDFYDGNHPPILSAFTEDEIYLRLVQSIEMGHQGRKELGRRGYDFVKKYHGWENATEAHINCLREIYEGVSANNHTH